MGRQKNNYHPDSRTILAVVLLSLTPECVCAPAVFCFAVDGFHVSYTDTPDLIIPDAANRSSNKPGRAGVYLRMVRRKDVQSGINYHRFVRFWRLLPSHLLPQVYGVYGTEKPLQTQCLQGFSGSGAYRIRTGDLYNANVARYQLC